MVQPSTIPPAATMGDLGPGAHERQEDHGGNFLWTFEAPTFAAFDDQTADAGVDSFQRCLERRHDMEHRERTALSTSV